MPQTRATLTFKSDEGREYLYDDITGSIFPWNTLRETIIDLELRGVFQEYRKMLVEQYSENDVEAEHRFIQRWRKNYCAFVRSWNDLEYLRCPNTLELKEYIRNNSLSLLLVLTENCNLRCKYCSLSEAYPLNRKRTERKMSLDTAKRAVDWYVKMVEPQIASNPRKRLGLAFYGGDPLLNMPVLIGILEYVGCTYPNIFQPVVTTNGTLLTPDNVVPLVEHDVMVAISIDGPEDEHDRLRVDARDKGTFSTILKNLQWIKEHHPVFWKTKLSTISIFDWGTDLEAVERYFAENSDILPSSTFVSNVGTHNTDWYDRYTPEDQNRMNESLKKMRERYKQAKIEDNTTSDYLNCLIGMDFSMVFLRRRALDKRVDFLPYSGTCVPGDKLAIQVDGTIDICERVNGSYPIGHLDDGGIDYKRLQNIIEKYQRQILRACTYCSVTKHCSLCFTHVEQNAEFIRDEEQCAGIERSAAQKMADYVSVMEKNPDANFAFETDTAQIEKRLLFKY